MQKKKCEVFVFFYSGLRFYKIWSMKAIISKCIYISRKMHEMLLWKITMNCNCKNIIGFFAILYELKIVVQLESGYTQEINIDLEYDFPHELFSSMLHPHLAWKGFQVFHIFIPVLRRIRISCTFRSYYKLPTQNSEEPFSDKLLGDY